MRHGAKASERGRTTAGYPSSGSPTLEPSDVSDGVQHGNASGRKKAGARSASSTRREPGFGLPWLGERKPRPGEQQDGQAAPTVSLIGGRCPSRSQRRRALMPATLVRSCGCVARLLEEGRCEPVAGHSRPPSNQGRARQPLWSGGAWFATSEPRTLMNRPGFSGGCLV